jgi:hypothetical protein
MRILILTFLILVLSISTSSAHPGRTDSNGGHTCRTNCHSWGLEYGQYHFHNKTVTTFNRNSGISNTTRYPATIYKEETHLGTYVFWGIAILLVGFVMGKISRRNNLEPKPALGNNVIDVTPKQPIYELPPKYEEKSIELVGTITKTRYRKNGFFVVTFLANNEYYTIVGNYDGRLYKTKPYVIKGTLNYHPRYGEQIKVISIEPF